MPQQGDFPTPRSSFVQPVIPPGVDPDAGPFVQLTVSYAWLPYVLGALSQLRMRTTWQTASEADLQLAIDRATMLTNQIAGPTVAGPDVPPGYPPLIRQNPTTGDVEVSNDGGSTYTPAPGADPRNIITQPNPAVTDQQCQSARSAMFYIRNRLEQVTNGLSGGLLAAGLTTLIIGALADLGPYGLIGATILDAMITLAGIGVSAINGAMTSLVWDDFACILYCNMDANGFFPAAALSNILDDVDTQIGGTAATILHVLIEFWGYAGIINSGYMLLGSGACTGCACTWCYEWNFTVDSGGWFSNSGAVFIPPFSTVDISATGHNSRRCQIRRNFATTTITHVEFDFTYTAGTFNSATNRWAISYQGAVLAFSTANPGNGGHTVQWNGSQAGATAVGLAVSTCDRTAVAWDGAATITRCLIRGTGNNPFGADNC